MDTKLPTSQELQKLPVRAAVAYAARTARRVSASLRGVVPDDVLEDALALVEAVSMKDPIGAIEPVNVVRAGERVIAAYNAAPTRVQSPEKLLAVCPVIQATLAATSALDAAAHPREAREHMERVADQAQRAVDSVKFLPPKAAVEAAEAARRDYDILRGEYGEHDTVVIGEPVTCFGSQSRPRRDDS